MEEEIYYYLAFSYFLGIGPVRFASLMKKFGKAKKAYQANEKELAEVIGKNLAQKFILFRKKLDPEEKMKDLRKKEVVVVPLYSDLYPANLKNIVDPPICLYTRGDVNILVTLSLFCLKIETMIFRRLHLYFLPLLAREDLLLMVSRWPESLPTS